MRRSRELAEASPAEAEAVSALARYRKGRKQTGKGQLPQTSEEFRWRLLSGAEEDEAVSAAVKRQNQLGIPIELRSGQELEEALIWEILALAMRDPDREGTDANPYPQPFAKDSIELRELLSSNERDQLGAEYLDFAEQVDPCPSELPPELARAIANVVKKKDATALSNFGCTALSLYLISMGSQQSSSPTGSSENSKPSGSPE